MGSIPSRTRPAHLQPVILSSLGEELLHRRGWGMAARGLGDLHCAWGAQHSQREPTAVPQLGPCRLEELTGSFFIYHFLK